MAQVMTEVNNFIYELDNKIYVNLTNACTNECIFCIRSQKDDVKGTNMWLSKCPKLVDVISQLEGKSHLLDNGITFCGYGEPLLEVDLVIEISKYLKQNFPNTKIKINTNGHANAVLKRNIVPELVGFIDEISISLNAQNEELYNILCRPKIENAYNEMLNFAKQCASAGIKTTMSIVTNYKNYDVNIDDCKKVAQKIGANFRERPWIENGY